MASIPTIASVVGLGAALTDLTAEDSLRKQRNRGASSLAWDYAASGFAPAENSGLVDSSGYIVTATNGVAGFAYIPWFNSRVMRASFRVKCTKSVAGSRSVVGVANCIPTAVPDIGGTGTFTFEVGYVQGSGICVYRNRQAVAGIALADSSITDGDTYDITMVVDSLINPTGVKSGYPEIIVQYRVNGSTGAYVGVGSATVTTQFYNPKTIIVSSNASAGGIANLKVSTTLGTLTGGTHADFLPRSSVSLADEFARVMLPSVKSNGRLVVNMHGHSSNETRAAFTATYQALLDAGYTIVSPYMGGNLWGSPAAQALAAEVVSTVCAECGLDKRVFLYGSSMGSGAAMTAIAKRTFGAGNVSAAYLAQPVCDLSALWTNPSYTTLPAAYGNDTALRDASSPIAQDPTLFAGVPMLFTASAADTAINKTTHADAMIARIGTNTSTQLIVATGNHNDASHFRAKDTVRFFDAYL